MKTITLIIGLLFSCQLNACMFPPGAPCSLMNRMVIKTRLDHIPIEKIKPITHLAEIRNAAGVPKKNQNFARLVPRVDPLNIHEQELADDFVDFIMALMIHNDFPEEYWNVIAQEASEGKKIYKHLAASTPSDEYRKLRKRLSQKLGERKLSFDLKAYPLLLKYNNEIMTEICKLDFLKKLYLRDFGLTSFPEGLLDCTDLEVLDLRGNHVGKIPESVATSLPLKKLYLYQEDLEPYGSLDIRNCFFQQNIRNFLIIERKQLDSSILFLDIEDTRMRALHDIANSSLRQRMLQLIS